MNDLTHLHRHSWKSNKPKTSERAFFIAAMVVLVLAYGIVGRIDYDTAVAMEEAAKPVTMACSK